MRSCVQGKSTLDAYRSALLRERYASKDPSDFTPYSRQTIDCLIHMSAMLSDRGSSLKVAALASSLTGAGGMTGRLLSGYLLGRFLLPESRRSHLPESRLKWPGWVSSAELTLPFCTALVIGLGFRAEGDVVAYLIRRYSASVLLVKSTVTPSQRLL